MINYILQNYIFQILSRTKPAAGPAGQSTPAKEKGKQKQMPKLEDFLDSRDYTGAITFLEVITHHSHLMLSLILALM